MSDNKPLLYIKTVTSQSGDANQKIYDSRYTKKIKVDERLLNKIDLLIQRTQLNKPVLCSVNTTKRNIKGVLQSKTQNKIVVIDEDKIKHDVYFVDLKEIRIIKI